MSVLGRWLGRLTRRGFGDMPYSDEGHWKPLAGGHSTRIILPGSNLDWRSKAGSPWLNSAAWTGINWIAQSFPEATLSVATETADGPVYDAKHPLALLWDRPNPAYSGASLIAGVVLSLLCDGNAYLSKVRGRQGALGPPSELYWLAHWRMEPVGTDTRLVDHYEFTGSSGKPTVIALEDVVHIRYGLDPENQRRGFSPLKPVLREISTDNEAITFVAAILGNMGIPGVVLSTRDANMDIPEDQAERIKTLFQLRTTGDERGKPIVIPAPIQLDTLGLSPNDLALTDLIEQAIARILAVMGLSAMAVGLPDSQKTYSNYEEARRAAWQNAVLPLMATICACLDTQLLPDYKPLATQTTIYDTRNIEALQENNAERDMRARQNYVAGIWKRSEARTATGMDYGPEDEVYVEAVKAAAQAAATEQAERAKPETPQQAAKSADAPSPWVTRVMAELAALDAAGADADAQEA